MYRYLKFCVFTSVIAVIGILMMNTPQQKVTAQDTFDRGVMLTSIVDNVIFPAQEAFVDATVQLEADVTVFVDEPSVENLAMVQASWRHTSNMWEEIDIYAFDLQMQSAHNQVDKPPVNEEFVADILSGGEDITEEYVEGLGSTSRGLPAVEYLIFNPEMTDEDIVATFEDSHRADFLVALSQNLIRKAEDIQSYWSEDGRNYAQTFIEQDQEGGIVRGTINMIANNMFYFLEEDLQMGLGEPSGIATGTDPQPELVMSPRSGQSLQSILHHVISMHRIFNGGDSDDAVGFADYLDFLGAEFDGRPLSEVINERFENTINSMEAIEQPLEVAVVENPEQIAEVYENMRQLVIPIRADMGSQLGILITISSRDGDQ